MSDPQTILDELVLLSHHLGEEWREYVVVGEGNTSARIDDTTFWVKASGANLRTIDEHGFVRVYFDRLLALIETAQTDDDVTRGLNEAKFDATVAGRPSVETVLHAIALSEGDAQFVGHTHPVAVNTILCSQQPELLTKHIMPDAIVVCGLAPVYVAYVDPGIPLARAVRDALRQNIAAHRESPKVIYLQNHGMFALGQSAKEVENVTAMAIKNARVMAGTFALGGPRPLAARDVARIHTRPDEDVRRRKFIEK